MTGSSGRGVLIPAGTGMAFPLEAQQRLRLIAHAGAQVGDVYVCARDDPRERLSSHVTVSANGSMRRATTLYSGPPFFSPLLHVVDDPFPIHWIHGRCNAFSNGYRFGDRSLPNCHDNIVEALAPFGVDRHEVALDTFNAFMHTEFDDECRYRFEPPVIQAGAFIEFQAARDVLVAISACPYETEINNFEAKPMMVEVSSPGVERT